jgi:hypothetical protein
MFNEYKKPMWNDGWFTTRSWNNLYNDYELNHCCFGDGGDGNGDGGTTSDPTQAPDFTGLEDVQGNVSAAEAAAAAAAEAASAADPSMGFDQDAIDAATAYAADAAYDVDYNAFADLAGIGKYDDFNNPQADIFDQQIAKQDAAIADAIQADAQAKGYDVNVGVDPDGTFSYTAGPDGTLGDVAAVASGQIAGGLMDLSPAVNVAKALGLEISDPRDLSVKSGPAQLDTTREDEFALTNTLGDYQISSPTSPEDRAAMERADRAAEQLAIDQGVVSPTTLGPEYDPSAVGFQEAYDRNLQETMASLADTTGTSDIGGDNKTPEDKKEEETEVTTSDARPRSIAEYFASDLVYPPSSFKPNQYLTALLQRISPNEDLESIYRRLGYYDLPPRAPTDTETGVA